MDDLETVLKFSKIATLMADCDYSFYMDLCHITSSTIRNEDSSDLPKNINISWLLHRQPFLNVQVSGWNSASNIPCPYENPAYKNLVGWKQHTR
jgi:hypothetical protein